MLWRPEVEIRHFEDLVLHLFACVHGSQKRVKNSLELELGVAWCEYW